MMMRLWVSLGIAACLLGCGGGDSSKPLPKTAKVVGTVTLDSKPIEGAVVTYYPTGQAQGIECVGITDATGKYQLKQLRGGDGAPPGDYKVVISRYLKKDGTPLPPNEPPATAEAVESLAKRYSSFDATTLTAKVPDAGGDIPFELKSR